MTSLTHASAGAVAGAFIPNPFLAFLAGIIIHLAMDKIPHYWPEEKQKQNMIIGLDSLFSALFIGGLLAFPGTRNASIIAGALGGVAVDFFFVLVMRQKGKMAEWHTRRQPHKTQPVWILSDAVIFLFFTVLIYFIRWLS
jgi:xanthine/uracil permease